MIDQSSIDYQRPQTLPYFIFPAIPIPMPLTPLIPPNWSAFPKEFRSRMGTNVGHQRVMKSNEDLLIVAHIAPEHDEGNNRGHPFNLDNAMRNSEP